MDKENLKQVLSETGANLFDWISELSDEVLSSGMVKDLFDIKKDPRMAEAFDNIIMEQTDQYHSLNYNYAKVKKTVAAVLLGIDELIELLETENLTQIRKDFIRKLFVFIKEAFIAVVDQYPRHDSDVYIELCNPDAKVPVYQHENDAGADIFILTSKTLLPGETIVMPTGFKVSIPEGWMLSIRPRSGKSLKTKLRVPNSPGTIEPGYLEEVGVIVENIGTTPLELQAGERIAQLILERNYHANFVVVQSVRDHAATDRQGGFGSTEKN